MTDRNTNRTANRLFCPCGRIGVITVGLGDVDLAYCDRHLDAAVAAIRSIHQLRRDLDTFGTAP